ncbi:dihydroxy-acid dehydratase 2-like [Montipora capricornis]|uniref:dihydroxy-acid dehydratase 2-like n=1 Tax=Montipora capricornis TaxID=246305 RepID=UPI0035F213E6
MATTQLKVNSWVLTGKKDDQSHWIKKTGARAHLRSIGFKDEDFLKPLITVACPYINVIPCNVHFRELADYVIEVVEEEGGKAVLSCTPVISDAMTMGTSGMKYSLISRDWIADCIEITHSGYTGDGIICLAGCDKTIPGVTMVLPRLNAYGVVIYGGTMLPGCGKRHSNLSAGSPFEAIGSYSKGLMDIEDLKDVECHAIPGAGTCGGMFTANTMSSVVETLGLTLPGSASGVAVDNDNKVTEKKRKEVREAVRALFKVMKAGKKARDIMTRKAFENAVTVMYALGGSTNGVLHLLALAHESEVDFSIDDFNKIGGKVPLIANLKPHGKYQMADLDKIGGLPMQQLVRRCTGVCSQEPHANGGVHYHIAVKLEKRRRWLHVHNYIDRDYGIKVNFSGRHENYYTAWAYTTKEDMLAIQSENHPDLGRIGAPITSNACSANRAGSKRNRKALSIFDVSQLAVVKGIKTRLELLAFANQQKQGERTDLAEFIANRGGKADEEALSVGWEMEKAEGELARSKMTRIELLYSELGKTCVEGCDGRWLTTA